MTPGLSSFVPTVADLQSKTATAVSLVATIPMTFAKGAKAIVAAVASHAGDMLAVCYDDQKVQPIRVPEGFELTRKCLHVDNVGGVEH